MNCKNFKIKQKNYKRVFFCSAKRKEIDYHNCSKECEHYEDKYKMQTCTLNNPKTQKIKNIPIKNKKSKEIAKLERNRFSLFSDNKNKCYLCPATTDLTWHEIFRGRNRANSMKYGLCLRLCINCHEKYQEDKEFNDYWHKKAQIIFVKTYSDLDFLKTFKKNYLN
ncbi:MAG: hypothetical protein NC483_00420 [Ruminococcus sp.]|nr:hypothetical protein [Ruminococcus sp.]